MYSSYTHFFFYPMLLGDFLLLIGLLIWLSISVGPWWIGPILFVAANLLNAWVTKVTNKKIEQAKQDHLERMVKFINAYKSGFPEE